MFRLRELTLARSRKGCGAGCGDGVRFDIFLAIISLLSGIAAVCSSKLTRPKDAFVEDLSEEEMRTRTSWTG
jgi:hypothetical protein